MKILIINSRNFLSAGPERYMFNIIRVLENHGHDVIVFSIKNKNNVKTKYDEYFAEPIGGVDQVYFEEYNKLNLKTDFQMLGRQFYSFHVKNKLEKLIKETKPDIAYILHHYNKLSPSIIDACKKFSLPVVMRLSDFFLVCPENHLLRGGAPCEECIEKSLLCAVRYRCVKKSALASLIKASAMLFHRLIRIYKKVDYVVSPSQFTIGKVQHLFNRKVIYIPTLIGKSKDYSQKLGKYALFVGRVEEEKGLLWAIKAIEKTKCKLKIVGKSHSGYDKVLRDYVLAHKIANVEFIGSKFGSELEELYMNARLVLLPNLWYENMPNVALEAMSYGKPIITSDLGSMRDIVTENRTGFLVKLNDVEALKRRIELLFNNNKLCKRLGRHSYLEAKSKYAPEKHYERLMDVFRKAIAGKKMKQSVKNVS